jgi:hypothetical protein
MAFVNLYHPPSPSLPPADPYGPDPYDLNFCLPIPAVLSTSLVKLIPLVPRAHADAIWAAGGSDQSLYRHILFPMRTKNEFLERLQGFQKDTIPCPPMHPLGSTFREELVQHAHLGSRSCKLAYAL